MRKLGSLITRDAMLGAWMKHFNARGASESLAIINKEQLRLSQQMTLNARKRRHDDITAMHGVAYGVLGQCKHIISRSRRG